MTVLGIGTTINKLTIFTCMNIIIKERYYGTSIGILYVFQNISILLSSLVAGEVLDNSIKVANENNKTHVVGA